ncbi:hypothetical protein V1511DRAFT_519878 [Dipodascopsis uninucleata]
MRRGFATTAMGNSNSAGPTGVVLLNMGGPSTLPEVYDFLFRLFADKDLIPLGPFQENIAKFIAYRRTPKIREHYSEIGGGSPIRKWSELQGSQMCKILDRISPETAPHKPYVAFRYAAPLTEETVLQMKGDNIKRAVAFTQYPQYSHSTTGSSLNELARVCQRLDPESDIKWSIIDRWPTHSGLIKAFADRIKTRLLEYDEKVRNDVIILFSAHSLPLSVVNQGDSYPTEVAATVHAVMSELNFSNPYKLVWQSKVGPSKWLGPQTTDMVGKLVGKGKTDIILVPIAFTSDHIETLHELDIELIGETENAPGLKRAESLNDHPIFIEALADLVANHLKRGDLSSKQFEIDASEHARDFFLK